MIVGLQYFLFLVVFLIITVTIGNLAIRFVARIKINGFFKNLYISLIAGSLLEVVVYATLETNGKTSLILSLPIIAYFIFVSRARKESLHEKTLEKSTSFIQASFKCLLLLPVLLILFLIEFLFFFDFSNNSFLPQTTLFSYYSYVSEFIALTGEENPFHIFNFLDQDYRGVAPYHYYELWTNALLNFIFNGLSVVNLLSITFPFFYFTTFIGILAIIETYKKSLSAADILLGVFLLFIAGVYFSFYNEVYFLRSAAEYSKIIAFGKNRKLASVFAFIPAIFLLFLHGNRKYVLVFCLLLPLHNVILFPPIIGGIILALLLNVAFKRDRVLPEALMTGLFIILFGGFYIIFASKLNVNQNDSLKVLTQLLEPAKMKTRINIVLGSFVYTFVAFLPLLIGIALFFWRKAIFVLKEYYSLFIFFLLISFSGLITWALLFEMIDSNQFFTQIHGIFFNFSIIFILINLIYNSSFAPVHKRFVMPGLLVLIGVISIFNILRVLQANYQSTVYGKNNFDPGYLKQITDLVQQGKISGVGGYIKSKEEFSGAVAPLNALFSLKGMYFPVIKPELIAISLDYDFPVKEDPLTREREKRILQYSSFLRFVEKQKSEGAFIDFAQSQIDYIKLKDLKFVILSEGAYPSAKLLALAEYKITDPASKETILLLKK